MRILFILLLCCIACDNRKGVDALQYQTEVIHDHAMADLADLVRTKSALRKELAQLDSSTQHQVMRDSFLAALADMAKADDDMKTWMVHFKSPGKDMPKEEAITYLKEQKDFIEKNAADISASTDFGKRCLEMLNDSTHVQHF